MPVHALLSASGAKRWMSCPPSARLEERLKTVLGESSSPFAAEGTKAHSLSELKLLRELGRMGEPNGVNEFNYTKRREALGEIPAEMENATDFYVDTVMEKFMMARKACPDAKLLIEVRLDFSRWVPHGFGTGDSVIVSDVLLEVIDLKYGKGVRVEAEENPQARCYGLGALDLFGELYGFPKVRNTIVQPRLDHVPEETLTREELLRWAEEELKPKAELAWRGEGEFHAGDHCRFCVARAICRARAMDAMKVLDSMEALDTLPESEIPRILDLADVAMDWIKDLKQYALSQALRGQRWPGYKLVHGRRPARVWKDEEAAEEQLIRAGYTKQEYTVEPKLRTVSQMEKAIGKTAFATLLGDFTTQPEGAPTLVPEDDKRPEIQSAEFDFADLTDDQSEQK